MAETTLCAGCKRVEEEKQANSWCIDCSEPVCITCVKFHKKLSPPHKVVEINEVHGVTNDLLKISTYCDKHPEEKVSLFCCQHDAIICAVCVSQSHKGCDPVISLNTAASGVKMGTAITDLEKRIQDMIKFLEEIMKRTDCRYIDNLKAVLIDEIRNEKQKIIEHLDKLEETLLHEVEKTFAKIKTDVDQHEHFSYLPDLQQWETGLKSLKKSTSDVHLFQVVKFLDKKLHHAEQDISTSRHPILPVIQFAPSEISDKIEHIQLIGKIVTKEPEVPVTRLEIEQQGQTSVVTKPQMVSSMQTSQLGSNVKVWRGCFISESRLFLSDFRRQFIYICNTDGSHSKSIRLDFYPQHVAMFDSSTVLITSFDDFIQIINLPDLTLGRKIKVGVKCSAIGCRDDRIWIKSDDYKFTMISINGQVLSEMRTNIDPWDICVHQSGEIFFTSTISSLLCVISESLKDFGVYTGSDLTRAAGVAIDDTGYIFVSCEYHNNIHRISPDGNEQLVVLKTEDGIFQPIGLAYQKSRKLLMVLNECGSSIRVYKV